MIGFSVLLSDVSIDCHLTCGRLYMEIENAGASLHKFGPKRGKTCLTPICKVDSSIIAPVVAAVISTHGNPLHSVLLFNLAEKTCVDGLAAGDVSLLSMDWIVICKRHVLLKRVMHESQTILASLTLMSN